MGKIDKFFGRKVEVSIGGETYSLSPFTIKDIPMISRLSSQDKNEMADALLECVYMIAKQIDPECTKEQSDQIDISFLDEFVNAITKINSIELDESRKALIDKLREKQNGKLQE